MVKVISLVAVLFLSALSVSAQENKKGFSFTQVPTEKKVLINWNGRLLTAYCYPDSVFKPFLFPVNTVDGITVTRGYPLAPVAGDRTDHPHHTGIWMNYESVNGLDFWNNSTAIPPQNRHRYGTIRHTALVSQQSKGNTAALTVKANWLHPDGHTLLQETTTYTFSVTGKTFSITRVSQLTAAGEEVVFKDVKDGFLAIRVARELEMPSTQEDRFVDAQGNETAVKKMDNAGVTGMYTNDAGVRGDSVWSTKGRWAVLKGQKGGQKITISMIDHPKNTGYPGYWHARGYGLFALNPLGRKIFSNGTDSLNLRLKPNSSITFRYRILVTSGAEVTPENLNRLADDFAKLK